MTYNKLIDLIKDVNKREDIIEKVEADAKTIIKKAGADAKTIMFDL